MGHFLGSPQFGVQNALNPLITALETTDTYFKRFSIYLRLPVKLVKKQLGLVHSIGDWEDFTFFSDIVALISGVLYILGETFSNLIYDSG